MFNDRFLLTDAVLQRRKTQTRRFIHNKFFSLIWEIREDSNGKKTLVYENDFGDFIDIRNSKFCPYKIGEVVAVAQSYENAGVVGDTTVDFPRLWDDGDAGYLNKMFVKAKLMPHQIKITNVRVQRLQEITDKECLLEGVQLYRETTLRTVATINDIKGEEQYRHFDTAREAYSFMIDALSRKGTWESNPWVFVYDFELVK